MKNIIIKDKCLRTLTICGSLLFLPTPIFPNQRIGKKNKNLEIFLKQKNWENVDTIDGITLERKKINNQPFFTLKASGIINTPIESILTILQNMGKANSWAPGLRKRKLITKISELERVFYDVHKLPWPFRDRELFIHNHIKLFPEKRQVALLSNSIHPRQTKNIGSDKFVTAFLHLSYIGLEPVSLSKTYVEFIICVDPKGDLPNWIFNQVAKKRPIKFLKSLERASASIQPGLSDKSKTLLMRLNQLLAKNYLHQ